jgi:tetratricopeptide (TPR) repeat protein
MDQTTQQADDRNTLTIIKGLLLSDVAFQRIFEQYTRGVLHFNEIGDWVDDKGQSLLYNLKERVHAIFRYNRKGAIEKKEWLLDLAIGSIFHEAMKLRENLYQLEVYRPRYLEYKERIGKSAYEKDYLEQFEKIISRAEQGMVDGMEETRFLFRDARAQLFDFFKANRQSALLVRFLLTNQPLLHKVYGVKQVKEIFNVLFSNGYLGAYQVAARSYLQSGHYDLASLYFTKASKLDPKNPQLQFLLHFSLGMNAYYKNTYLGTLSHFSKLTHPEIEIKGKRDYLRKADEVCRRIASELKEEKALRVARRAELLADKLKKCY